MSYGEPTLLPDYGRFVDLVNEVMFLCKSLFSLGRMLVVLLIHLVLRVFHYRIQMVNKYRMVFVSSTGNNGPALSTVGAPGGTTSSIIGIGAYVSPAMAAGAHCAVEAPLEGLEYTWYAKFSFFLSFFVFSFCANNFAILQKFSLIRLIHVIVPLLPNFNCLVGICFLLWVHERV